MSEPTVPPGLLAAMLDEQRRTWRRGERVLVESFLTRVPELKTDRSGQLDLIYNEIVLREEVGERASHQEYLERFPDLRDDLALQFEVDRALNLELLTAEQVPQAAPFAGMRFPAMPGYEILGILGRGKRGLVYKARHGESGQLRALKIILSGVNVGDQAVRNFHAEAHAWMKFKNPHIVSILDISVQNGRLVIAMELLERSVAMRVAGNDPVPPKQAVEWLEKIARTLHEVHQRGLTHRNLSAANILLGPDEAIKLADFALEPNVTPEQAAPGWLPEEQATDALPRGVDADIRALGTILYEMLTGGPPNLLAPRRPKLPRALEAICHTCWQDNPRRRYGSAAALAADLSAYLNGMPVRASRGRSGGESRNRTNWQFVATAALIGFGVSWAYLPIAMPAAVAVLGFALGCWWSEAQARRALSVVEDQQTAAQKKTTRLALLLELGTRLHRVADLEDVLPHVVETALWLVDAEQAVVFHVDPERRELWARSNGAEVRAPLGAGIVGTVAKLGEAIFVDEPVADARFSANVDGCVVRKPRNLLATPLRNARGVVVGVLLILNKRDRSYKKEDVEVLSDYLGAVAAVVESGLTMETKNPSP
jgi:hypothetical protein